MANFSMNGETFCKIDKVAACFKANACSKMIIIIFSNLYDSTKTHSFQFQENRVVQKQ
jgi:hypothetical protein